MLVICSFTESIFSPAVGGVDLALEVRLFVVRPGGGQLPVEGEHLFDQGDHPVVVVPGPPRW